MMIQAFRHGDHNMHWFWRAVIAMGAGAIAAAVAGIVFGIFEPVEPLLLAVIAVVYSVTSLRMYHVLTCESASLNWPNELRCRKCDYILRGITEPRCPECGEGI